MQKASELQRFLKKPILWPEICSVPYENIKFSPYGSATTGIPDFFRKVASEVVLNISVDDYQYTEFHGRFDVRESFTKYFAPMTNFKNLNPFDHIAVSNGGLGVTENIIKLLVKNEDDEVILFEPIYSLHCIGLRQKGKLVTSQMKYCEEIKEFAFDFENLENKLSAKTKLVIFSNPNNPTTRLFRSDEYQQLTELLNKYPQAKVVEDCAYFTYVNDPNIEMKYFHEFGQNYDKTYTIFSAGKIFNTTGNRLGWTFAEKSLINSLKEYMQGSNPSGAIEQSIYAKAVAHSFEHYEGFENFWKYMKQDNIDKIEYFVKNLESLGLPCLKSQGTYYLLVDISKLVDRIDQKYYMNIEYPTLFDPNRDRAVARKLVLEYGIGSIPISVTYVSDPLCDQFLRIACNRKREDLDMLISAIKSILR